MGLTLKLNSDNYHSTSANSQYMSVSLFKKFLDCEARTMAELRGDYTPPLSNALVVGSYVHAAFENPEAFAAIEEQYSDMIFKKRGGGKYADFETADRMIDCLKADPFVMFALEGDKEEIYTGELFGAQWKIKVDSINHIRKTFSDIKTTSDLHKRYWSTKYDGWVSFVEEWGYVFQMAIYREIIKQNEDEYYTPYIVAVTKENPPNKAVLHIDDSRFDFELEFAEMKLERILQVKSGEVDAVGCQKCDYCRTNKKLSNTMEIGDLINV
ncbi:PD-(D/E)XK nuclease-like domain-containing protein [Halalkalibacterium halodurans]|uniref:PD-(D/E)XK nuclease-like domain-containing protein n=2 Tax=Halalkalibacterium halodurans TaxID=86665 RepID=UPI002AABA590|nr:PD-(D/E)XK nuclease-like domain-containing protein [Halalkalibacterium halodurans]